MLKRLGLAVIGFVLIVMFQNCSGRIDSSSIEGIKPKPTPEEDLKASNKPNVLFIIADDLGLGEVPGYDEGEAKPNMPHLEELISTGVSFDNVWAYPACSPTRASILSGKSSFRTGVTDATQNSTLDANQMTIFDYLKSINSPYETAVFGKWHVSRNNANGPSELGVDEYRGLLTGGVDDYYSWDLTENGSTSVFNGYITKKITDMTTEWISTQSADTPWFAWVAYTSPHTPFHLPPEGTYSQVGLSGTAADIAANPQSYFFAMIENLDYEMGRLLDSLTPEVRSNTVVVFLGDNGTTRSVIQPPYQSSFSSKGRIYQGGIHVPLIVSGVGVENSNARSDALVSSVDLHPTLLDIMGYGASNTIDGVSFKAALSPNVNFTEKEYLVSETSNDNLAVSGKTIRNAQYKYFIFDDDSEVFVDLIADPYELSPLSVQDLAGAELANFNALKGKITELISLGDSKDITDVLLTNDSPECSSHTGEYLSDVLDVFEDVGFSGSLNVSENLNSCVFTTSSIPNHNFNDGVRNFVNVAAVVNQVFEVTKTPTAAASTSELQINADNAIFLNGVKLDILAAACYGVGPDPLGSERIGCGDITTPWRYDPMSELNNFSTDTHNAHTQANGTYHYHGDPNALFNSTETPTKASPVIGFAADGFPIFGSFINDEGTIRKVVPGYTLKAGARVSQAGEGAFPGGSYDGTFRDDYEFTGTGDLDECNGMVVDGTYRYYVTDSFPWVMACFKGTPDSSFIK